MLVHSNTTLLIIDELVPLPCTWPVMWLISRCISVASANSCFSQQKKRTSYNFGFPKKPSELFERRIDDDDCEPLPRRTSYNSHLPTRRRISKRYSDIVGPCSSTNIHRRHPNERLVARKKSRDRHDLLAHRMQAAMSSELMHSLDRNVLGNDRKQKFLRRAQTFHSYSLASPPFIPRANIPYQQILIRRCENKINHEEIKEEEPEIDYDQEEEETPEDQSNTLSDFPAASASFIVPPLSTTNTEEQTTFVSDLTPDEQEKSTFHCRTIADRLTPDHKLILKDNAEETSDSSKPITVQNSSPVSLPIDPESEHRSTSSKIYRDYKQRTYLTNRPTSLHRHASLTIEPIHTKISLRSSPTTDKLLDMTLMSKQMNVCVINQLNDHLSTRFRQYEQSQIESPVSLSNYQNSSEHQSYDLPPEFMPDQHHQPANFYDEPNEVRSVNQTGVPPPPPPLPVGGFPPIKPPDIHSSRTSAIPVARETTSSDHLSTASSNLSDTRILRELRDNPLFTRAKQHLEYSAPTNNRVQAPETVTYVRLEHCVKAAPSSKELETIVILPTELDSLIGKRAKSSNDLQHIKTRPGTKVIDQSPPTYRQSELELIFQKRAQRSMQNLT